MVNLDKKYVLHVPLAKYVGGNLIDLDIDDILEELYGQLAENGFEVFYLSKAEGHYGLNVYNQLLITVFTSSDNSTVDEVFAEWFFKNNDVLCQKEFAFECCGKLTVHKLDI